MRKAWFVLLLCLLAVMPALAQDTTETPLDVSDADLEPWTCPEGFEGQTLSVFNWSTYVAEDTISNFEELCGVTVIYDVYESNEAMLARLRQGNPGYDILVPTDYVVEIMIQEELIQPIDLSKIPNFRHVAENLIDTPYDPGNQYSVPYQWGTLGIGYNQTVVGYELKSWKDLFEYEGPVAWLEDPRAMIDIGLMMLGEQPPATDPEMVFAARDALLENGGNVVAIAQDDGQALLERGDVHATIEYSGDIFQIMDSCECDDFVYVIPEEGANLWTDNLVIASGAPNPELAHVFIDYILDPRVSADIANYTAYGSPNQTAIDLGYIDEELLSNPAIYPSEEISERLYFSAILPPEVDQAYADAWDEVKILLRR